MTPPPMFEKVEKRPNIGILGASYIRGRKKSLKIAQKTRIDPKNIFPAF